MLISVIPFHFYFTFNFFYSFPSGAFPLEAQECVYSELVVVLTPSSWDSSHFSGSFFFFFSFFPNRNHSCKSVRSTKCRL